MDAKYYTPELSEFHVGFECEIQEQPNGIWKQGKLTEQDMCMFLTTIIALSEGRIRVKYLDNEDVESCGWRKKNAFGVYEIVASIDGLGKTTYCLQDSNNMRFLQNNVWRITNEWHETIFFGSIKNKSELKQLMKMLGINGN